MKISMDMEVPEALYALAAIQAHKVRAQHTRTMMAATGAPEDEREIVEVSFDIYDRLERRLSDLLYPVPA